jgi:hypothetical protein
MTSRLQDLDSSCAGDASIKSNKNSNINSVGTNSDASHDVVTESGNGYPIVDCKGERSGNNSSSHTGVGDYDSNNPLLVSITRTPPFDVGVDGHASANPLELAYSSQRPVPQKNTTDLQATGGLQQNRRISISDSKDVDLESSEGGKVKSNPTTSFEQESPSRKYNYNHNGPIVELAVARAIPCDVDSRKKFDIKQVAIPAFEHDYHYKSFCRRYAIVVGGCVVLGIAVVVLLLVILSNDTAPVYQTDAPSVTKAPTASPTKNTRESIVINYLTEELAPKVLVDGTSYSKAADWFLYQDSQPAGLSVQRYALAVFYFFSTRNGSKPWRSCNPPFLSFSEEPRSSSEKNYSATENTNICTFLEPTRSPDGSSMESKEIPGKIRWLSSFHECEWQGVVCSVFNQVQSISLAGQGIQGNFSSLFTGMAGDEEEEDNYFSNSLFRAFPFLQIINLSYNDLTGTLPASFADFPDLLNLELHGNSLSGEIPSSLFDKFTSLQLLNLGENRLSGSLDTKIGQLTELRGLHLHQNYFRGQFPSEIGKLSSFLTHSRIYGNKFSGLLPTELGRLTHLIDFQYANNLFKGTIPTQFGQLTSIDIFRLDDNQLSGTIPVELCNLTNSRAILLERNVLTGPLPTTELSQLKRLVRFHVNNNQLTGPIPSELGDLPDLQLVWLHLNEFSGSMPTEVCEVASIPNKGISLLQADCEPIENPANPCRCCTACCDRSTGVCLSV